MSRAKATSTQLNHLVEYMKAHTDCASGRGSGLQGKVELDRQWQELTEVLNSLGGPVKSAEKWKQTWRDLRNGVKKKALKNKRELKGDGPGGTGNGPSQLETFSVQDEAVMSVIGPVAVYGMDGVAFTMPVDDTPGLQVEVEVAASSAATEPIMEPDPEPPMSNDSAARCADPAPMCSTQVLGRSSSVPAKHAAPRRTPSGRRITTRNDSFDNQIIKIEKERLEIQKRKLVIDEAKVAAYERIAAALEERNLK